MKTKQNGRWTDLLGEHISKEETTEKKGMNSNDHVTHRHIQTYSEVKEKNKINIK